ncbi:MAG: acyl carrier protein [Candidatus Nitrosotenuis sp.]
MSIEDDIMEIFTEVFPNLSKAEFNWNRLQKDYENWDSFAHLHLISLTESKFNITFSIEETISINSAAKLLEYVRAHK